MAQRLAGRERPDQADDRQQGAGAERHREDDNYFPAEQPSRERREAGFLPR